MSCLEILSQKSSNSHKECADNPQDHVTWPLEFNAENDKNHGILTCDVREMAATRRALGSLIQAKSVGE
jgi:hypothetical protein